MLNGVRQAITRLFAPPSSQYLRGPSGSHDVAMLGPRPMLRDASEDVRAAWSAAASRAIDAIHNSGWIAGVVDQVMSLMIGDGLQLNFTPDMTAFGWDESQSSAWARRAERRFRAWSTNPVECDAGGRYTLAQQNAAAVRQWFGTGEIFAEFPSIRRSGAETMTKVRLLPSHWCSQRSDQLTGLVQGVFLDGSGAAAGYLFDVRDRKTGSRTEIRRPARDGFGRPVVLQIMDGQATQVRGMTVFAPIIRTLRDYDQLKSATLAAKMIHAIFAATIESDYPTNDVFSALQSAEEQNDAGFKAFLNQKVGWSETVKIDLGRHGKIPHLMMGERLKLHTSALPNEAFEPFANFLMREVARCIGALPSDLTGDYKNESYTGVRMGISKQWPLLMFRRKHIAQPLMAAAFGAWLEEEVDRGTMELPGGIDAFVANRASITSATWRGPAKPVADEVKAAKAHEVYRNMGVVTDEMICADLGVDHEDVYAGRAREKAMRETFGIHGGITNGGSDVDALIGESPARQN